MSNRIIILGSGNNKIDPKRAGSSVLTELDDGKFVLFDCGRGVLNRIAELEIELTGIQNIIFSHFHPDHVSDLVSLLHASVDFEFKPDLHLYGPVGLIRFFEDLKEAFTAPALTSGCKVICHEFGEASFSVLGQEIEYVKLTHPDNHGVRFSRAGKTIAFTGDSSFDDLEVSFLQGVDFAVVDGGHPSPDELVQLAVRSQVKTIVFSHLYHDLDLDYLTASAMQSGYKGKIMLAQDLMSFSINQLD